MIRLALASLATLLAASSAAAGTITLEASLSPLDRWVARAQAIAQVEGADADAVNQAIGQFGFVRVAYGIDSTEPIYATASIEEAGGEPDLATMQVAVLFRTLRREQFERAGVNFADPTALYIMNDPLPPGTQLFAASDGTHTLLTGRRDDATMARLTSVKKAATAIAGDLSRTRLLARLDASESSAEMRTVIVEGFQDGFRRALPEEYPSDPTGDPKTDAAAAIGERLAIEVLSRWVTDLVDLLTAADRIEIAVDWEESLAAAASVRAMWSDPAITDGIGAMQPLPPLSSRPAAFGVTVGTTLPDAVRQRLDRDTAEAAGALRELIELARDEGPLTAILADTLSRRRLREMMQSLLDDGRLRQQAGFYSLGGDRAAMALFAASSDPQAVTDTLREIGEAAGDAPAERDAHGYRLLELADEKTIGDGKPKTWVGTTDRRLAIVFGNDDSIDVLKPQPPEPKAPAPVWAAATLDFALMDAVGPTMNRLFEQSEEETVPIKTGQLGLTLGPTGETPGELRGAELQLTIDAAFVREVIREGAKQ